MANPQDIAELHEVFGRCGIPEDPATRALIIERQGFTNVASLGKLKSDHDISEMAKLMSQRTQADGGVHLGIVVVQDLQTLVWLMDS
jgi:hypothetical protein